MCEEIQKGLLYLLPWAQNDFQKSGIASLFFSVDYQSHSAYLKKCGKLLFFGLSCDNFFTLCELFLLIVKGNFWISRKKILWQKNNLSFMLQMNFANRIIIAWRDLMENKSDPRTTNWMLMSSPFPTILICLSYVYIVKVSFVMIEQFYFCFCCSFRYVHRHEQF